MSIDLKNKNAINTATKSRAGWQGRLSKRHLGRSSNAKDAHKRRKKANRDRRTDQRTERVIESRACNKKTRISVTATPPWSAATLQARVTCLTEK